MKHSPPARFLAASICTLTLLVALAALALTACGDSSDTASLLPPSPQPSASAATPSPATVHPGVILYARLWPSEGDDICLINSDGTGYEQLTQVGEAEGIAEPASWSPSGARIAYHAAPNISARPNVWTMNADGSKKKRLTNGRLGGLWPAFSPDGKRIAYASYWYPTDQLPPAHIFVMNADGSGVRQVTRGAANDMFPVWTPEGTLLFLRKPPTRTWDSPDGDVWAVRPDGSGLARVTSLGHVGAFGLSPNGKTLALHDTERHQIVLLSGDGGGTPSTLVDTDFDLDLVQPAWSPDGKAIALAHSDLMTPASPYDAASLGLWVVNADGSGLAPVPNAEGVLSISWRPE